MHEGLVKFFNAEKGYGFIVPSVRGPEPFFHITNVIGGEIFESGQRVRYEVRDEARGARAYNVEAIG